MFEHPELEQLKHEFAEMKKGEFHELSCSVCTDGVGAYMKKIVDFQVTMVAELSGLEDNIVKAQSESEKEPDLILAKLRNSRALPPNVEHLVALKKGVTFGQELRDHQNSLVAGSLILRGHIMAASKLKGDAAAIKCHIETEALLRDAGLV